MTSWLSARTLFRSLPFLAAMVVHLLNPDVSLQMGRGFVMILDQMTGAAPSLNSKIKVISAEDGKGSLQWVSADWRVVIDQIFAAEPASVTILAPSAAQPLTEYPNDQIAWSRIEDESVLSGSVKDGASNLLFATLGIHQRDGVWYDASGDAIPLHFGNRFVPMPVSSATLQNNLVDFVTVFKKAQFDGLHELIEPGDLVLVSLSDSSTTATVASLMNANLSGHWIKYFRFYNLPVFSLMGFLLVIGFPFSKRRARLVWGTYAALTGLIATGTLFGQVVMDAFPALFAFVFLVLAFLSGRIAVYVVLRNRFVKLVSSDYLKKAVASVSGERHEIVATVIHLELCKYQDLSRAESLTHSQATERAVAAFKDLAKNEGAIVTTLDHALVAIFGWTGSGMEEIHGSVAVDAAIKMIGISHFFFENDPTLSLNPCPIRIGIHSGIVRIGHSRRLGSKLRFEGRALDRAQDLSATCEPFRITLSDVTHDVLVHARWAGSALVPRKSQALKGDAGFVYELDPFANDKQKISDILLAIHKTGQQERKGVRCTPQRPLYVSFGGEQGRLVNFSNTGFLIELGSYLAKGFVGQVKISSGAQICPVEQALSRFGLSEIEVSVRWGRKEGDLFLHGLSIENLVAEKKDILEAELKRVTIEKAK